MYRLSLLPRKVLITSDEVIHQGHTDENPAPGSIISAIQIAEERFVKPAIGKELYYDFREKKNHKVTELNKGFLEALINEELDLQDPVVLRVGDIVNAIELVDNTWYVELWNEYLWKITAEAVIYIATPTNFSRYTASGEEFLNPKTLAMTGEGRGSSSVELKDVKWKMDKMLMDRIDPLLSAMHEWLCDHREHFPLYAKKCSKNTDGISLERKTPWIHGIYDKDKKGGCRE